MKESWGNAINADSVIQLSPFDFIRSGQYVYASGKTASSESEGYYLQAGASGDINIRYLRLDYSHLRTTVNFPRGTGFKVRCLVSLVFLATPYLQWY